MPNYTGNKNAQKWTREKVKSILDMIKQNAGSPDILFISDALTDLNISRKAWSYWKHIYANDEDITDRMDVLEGIFEKKLTQGAMNGEINTTFAIFALKHNYRWSDRPHVADRPYIEEQHELRPDTNLNYILCGGKTLRVLPLEELTAISPQTTLPDETCGTVSQKRED